MKRRIDELKAAGLYEDTIIVIWSDHGNGLPRAKRWLYDSGTKVPLIVRIPEKFRVDGQGTAGSVDERLVNLIDLGPTMLNMAGLDVPRHMAGREFLGSKLPSNRKYIFGARQRIDANFDMVRSVRDKRYRYVRNFMPFTGYFPYLEYAEKCNTMKEMRRLHADGKLNEVQAQWMADTRPAEELYDLENDPWETRNLAEDAGYAKVKKKLRKVLEKWMVETRDTGLIIEPEMIRLRKKAGSEYAILHSSGGRGRTEKLLKTANLGMRDDAAAKKRMHKAAKDNDELVRYWAVLSLGQLESHSEEDIQLLEKAAKDSCGSVRVAAGQALYLAGQKAKAVAVLENELKDQSRQYELLHYAVNVLDSFGDEAASALETVKALNAAQKEKGNVGYICEHFIEKFGQEEKSD